VPKVLLLYQYYRPDDVVSALQFTGLGEGLSAKNWEVETWPCNRSCHHEDQNYSLKSEKADGVLIRRVWRPAFNQHRFIGRVLNAAWVEMAWLFRAFLTRSPDAVVIGTDPIFAVLLVPFLKLRWPRTKIAHWCFDLYPEYAVAEGLISENSGVVRFLKKMLRWAYRKCDVVVDLGACMRKKLEEYPIRENATLTPWALEEPAVALSFDADERKNLFGNSSLGLLYSGNLSHPHEFEKTVTLARKMGEAASFVFSARGKRVEVLKSYLTEKDTNIRFVPFASVDKLMDRLSAPDIHIVSLKSSYTGVAVPSKFFGALAVGRPILFEGDEVSAIAGWIRQYGLGWVLTDKNTNEIAADMTAFSMDNRRKLELFTHCHNTYQKYFSKKAVLDGWESELKKLLAP